jgi:chemotaxis family two-component system sensor kinase Cph1
MKTKMPTEDVLRIRAEASLKLEEDPAMERTEDDMRRLIHELRVHQVELELQNEDLRGAHARIEESRTRFADLYDFAPVGYFTFDELGRIIEVNLTGAKLLGIERSNLINAPFSTKVIEPDRMQFRSHLRKIFQTREADTCEVRLGASGSKELWVRLDSIFMKSADGALFCRTSVTDISEKKRTEEALQRAYAELTKENVERRRAEDEARHYAERIERINNELQEFAYVASHDMQEPLRKIQTFIDMAIKRSAPVIDNTSRDYLDRALASATRMRQLMSDLLQLSRVTTMPGPFKKLNLAEIVREAADIFEEDAKRHSGVVEIGELPRIEADETQMLRLFQNLIGNALKFHGSDPPELKSMRRATGRKIAKYSYKTMASDSNHSLPNAFSSLFSACIIAGSIQEPEWGLPSASKLWSGMGEASAQRANRGKVRHLSSGCQ